MTTARMTINLNTTTVNNNFEYPKLSDFIKDLNEVLDKYGDGLICIDNEYTDEVNQIVIIDLNHPCVKHMYSIGYDAKPEEK